MFPNKSIMANAKTTGSLDKFNAKGGAKGRTPAAKSGVMTSAKAAIAAGTTTTGGAQDYGSTPKGKGGSQKSGMKQ